MNNVEYLIISSTIDYSTDLICIELEKQHSDYLRINRDKFSSYKVNYDLQDETLYIKIGKQEYLINNNLKAVYFRAPVFLRSNKAYAVEEQLYRSQWNAFIKNLIVFRNAHWINYPPNTYESENKVYQLQVAKRVGLDVPKTFVANYDIDGIDENEQYIVKSIDTALFYDEQVEMFAYSEIVSGKMLKQAELRQAPIIIQELLKDKLDIRVTVVGNNLFPVAISENGHNISGDWRKNDKDKLQYIPVELPGKIAFKLKEMMSTLGLTFGGIDLALSNGKYYFIEVNPTGEWGWLVYSAKIDIHKTIARELIGENI